MSEAIATRLEPQFDDLAQQHEAAALGMWTFLATELLLFGGLWVAYIVYRWAYPAAFAEASHHLYFWIGAANTAVLLTSSLTMVLAVDAARRGAQRADDGAWTGRWLLCTAALGGAFLALKAVEYRLDWNDRLFPVLNFEPALFADPARSTLFLFFYWFMTGIHAFHLAIGVALMTAFAWQARRGRLGPHAVEMAGLFWHFVDVVWIFLFPLLYMVG